MASTRTDAEPLRIAGRELRSRLLLGTGGFPSLELLAESIRASGSELVTVALRRVELPGAATGGAASGGAASGGADNGGADNGGADNGGLVGTLAAAAAP